MSKRTRGSRTSRTRPGYRPATQRPAQKGPAPKPSAAAAELDELEPVEVDVEPEAPRPAAQRPGRAGRAASQGSGRGQGLLAAKAQTEYAYVSSDLRRIGRFAAAIFGAMAVLWVLIDLTGVIRI
jgi:hypothetical protein